MYKKSFVENEFKTIELCFPLVFFLKRVIPVLLFFTISAIITSNAFSGQRLVVNNSSGLQTFSVLESGSVYTVSQNASIGIINTTYSGSGNWASSIYGRVARGSLALPQAVRAHDRLFFIGASGYDGSSFSPDSNAFLAFNASEDWSPTARGTYFSFHTTQRGTGNVFQRMILDDLGNVGFGVNSPLYPLEMASGAYVSTGGIWTNASSREYKENIIELTAKEAVAAFENLRPVKYNYKRDRDDRHVGFIAEDAPDLVATKDRKGLSPMDIVAVLTKVVQEQQRQITELSEKVSKLERENNFKDKIALGTVSLP